MRLLLMAGCLLVATGAIAQNRNYPPSFEGAREEVYKKVGDTELKVWIFEPEGHQPDDRRSAIVFFFGGGWRAGSPGQFEQHCRYLAEQGMVAMTADYRVLSRHNTLADKCVEDGKSAIRWIRANADRLGVDPNRVAAGGGSAGGHVAACTALVPGLDRAGEEESISSVPDALVLFNPAMVLAPYDGVETDPEKLAGLAERTGVPPQRISPIHHVREELPPTILFHGIADTTVHFSSAKRYIDVAKAAGNQAELVAYPGAGHGFFNYGRGGEPGDAYLSTVAHMHRFLHEIGFIKEPPSPESNAEEKDAEVDAEDKEDAEVDAGKDPEAEAEAEAEADSGASGAVSSNVRLRGDLRRSFETFKHQKHGTVAFLGGSITEMNGFRPMVENFLRRFFPATEFTFINAGIASTCSTTGAFRLQRDVLSHSPDLLFVEFAVNDDQDAAHSAVDCLRGMEGIVRQALRHNPEMDIVVTHFVNPTMLETLQDGREPLTSRQHEKVARHYDVSSVDVGGELAERIEAGTMTWKDYGGTHPREAGNRMAAELLIALLQKGWSTAHVAPRREMPEPLVESCYERGRLLEVGQAKHEDQWSKRPVDWAQVNGTVRERFRERELLSSQAIGAALTLPFHGTAIGLYVLAGPDAGVVEYSIDGSVFESLDLYHRYSKSLHYPRTVMLAKDLQEGPHQLVMRVGKDRNQASSGHAVRVLAFTVNGPPVSTLEKSQTRPE